MSWPQLVVRQHRPRFWLAVGAGAALFLLIGAVLIFWVSQSYSRASYQDTRSEVEKLRDERRRLARELRQVRSDLAEQQAQNAFLERGREIDRESAEALRQSLVSAQAEVAELREQVSFYQGIVSPEPSSGGARLLEAQARPLQQPGEWRLELVLVQSMQQPGREVAGRIDARVIGTDAGGTVQQLALESLLLPANALDRFSFRLFQQLQVDLRLPDQFTPQQLSVTLAAQRGTAVTKTMEWADLTTEQADPEADRAGSEEDV